MEIIFITIGISKIALLQIRRETAAVSSPVPNLTSVSLSNGSVMVAKIVKIIAMNGIVAQSNAQVTSFVARTVSVLIYLGDVIRMPIVAMRVMKSIVVSY